MKRNYSIKPVVSVVIPVFNGASYLEETVKSIHRSTYRNFEVILVNDGSTDQSRELCHALEKRYRRVRFFDFNKNRGLDRVLNFALRMSKGQYICRINQDDIMTPIRLRAQVDYLETNPEVVAVGSSIQYFDKSGDRDILVFPPTDEKIKKIWLMLSPFSDPAVMYRKDIALAVGGYEQKFWPADDVQMWFKLGLRGKLANIEIPLTRVRIHDQAASVVYFRRDIQRTLALHIWANKHIAPASIPVWIFWFGQFIAGITLSPQFNWYVYRFIKKMLRFYEDIKTRLFNFQISNPIAPAVMPQPANANSSGR